MPDWFSLLSVICSTSTVSATFRLSWRLMLSKCRSMACTLVKESLTVMEPKLASSCKRPWRDNMPRMVFSTPLKTSYPPPPYSLPPALASALPAGKVFTNKVRVTTR